MIIIKENILLIYGGNSVEHEISIITALQIKKNYNGKYNIILCYLKNGNFYISNKLSTLNNYKNINLKPIQFKANSKYVKVKGKKIPFEAIWIVSHGKNCEDGTLSSYFKTLNIPVISLNNLSANIGQSKYLSKKLTSIPSLNSTLLKSSDLTNNKDYILNLANEIGYPLIIKPNNLGSSVGVSVINNSNQLFDELEKLLLLDEEVILEKCLNEFIELNIAILKYKNDLIVSEIEKVSNSKVLTYSDKYFNKNKSLNHQSKELPAQISAELKDQIISYGKQIYKDLNMSLIVRIDFLYDLKTKTLYFNEINNIPGSLAYYLFEQVNIPFSSLIDMCLDEGLKNIENSKKFITTYQNNILNDNMFNNVKFSK